MIYRAEIDGLRALSVLPVIFFHAGIGIFSGGFIGVDIFFVISGYLITGILLDELNYTNKINIIHFYGRRARRILPALILVILVTYLTSWHILNPFDLKELSQSIFATSIFSSNVFFYLKTGYFDTASELKPLLHTWSLAVEEQYYVIFPCFLILAWKIGRRFCFWSIGVLTFISLIISEWSSINYPSANFYLPHTRAWEILAGSMAAFLVCDRNVKGNNYLASVGIIALMASIVFFNDSMRLPGLYMLIPVSGTVLIILYASKDTLIGQILSFQPLVYVGLVSYSAYLWHQPIFALAKHYFLDELGPLIIGNLLIMIFALSYLTWKYVEKPFRKQIPNGKNPWKTLTIASFSLAIIGTMGMYGHLERGFPSRNENMLRLAQNRGLAWECSGATTHNEACISKPAPKIAVWGDSNAMHFTSALATSFQNAGVHQFTLSACPPVPNYKDAPRKSTISCEDFNSRILEYLLNRDAHTIDTVFLASTFNLAKPPLVELFKTSIGKLKTSGLNIVIVSPSPQHALSEACVTKAMRGRHPLKDCQFDFRDATNSGTFGDLRDLAKGLGIPFLDLSAFMCEDHLCSLENQGRIVLRDNEHFSNEIQPLLAIFLKQSNILRKLR